MIYRDEYTYDLLVMNTLPILDDKHFTVFSLPLFLPI